MFSIEDSYVDLFRRNICPICGICNATAPAFCMMMFGGDPERFFEMLKFINVIRKLNPEVINSFYSFEGFCGLFCNSYRECPARGKKCSELQSVFGCYECFVGQCRGVIKPEVKVQIWEKFSGISTGEIGKRFQLPRKDPLKALSKKKRKKINKLIKKARKGMKVGVQTFSLPPQPKKKVKTKPIETSFFFNEGDKEWERTIESYLSRETNNRQPIEIT